MIIALVFTVSSPQASMNRDKENIETAGENIMLIIK